VEVESTVPVRLLQLWQQWQRHHAARGLVRFLTQQMVERTCFLAHLLLETHRHQWLATGTGRLVPQWLTFDLVLPEADGTMDMPERRACSLWATGLLVQGGLRAGQRMVLGRARLEEHRSALEATLLLLLPVDLHHGGGLCQ